MILQENEGMKGIVVEEDILNEEIEGMKKLMSHKKHIERTHTVNRRMLMAVQILISKAYEDLQNKVWDPGGLRITVHDREIMVSFETKQGW